MRNLNIILILGTLTISCSNKDIPEASLSCTELIEKEGKFYYTQKLFSGSCFTLYDLNLEKNEIRTFKRGVRHGVWAKYHTNGFIEYQGSYKKGEIHGGYISFYPNGLLKESGKLDKGYRDGEWLLYNDQGELIRKEYHKDRTLLNYEDY